MEAEFDSSGDALFNYGYGCYVFTHKICRSKPQIPDGMPDPSVPLTPEFFANPLAPQASHQPLLLWTPFPLAGRIVRRVARSLPEKKRSPDRSPGLV